MTPLNELEDLYLECHNTLGGILTQEDLKKRESSQVLLGGS